MQLYQDVLAAQKRIRDYIRETPLDYSIPLSELTGAQVYLKLENLQYTNAFKARGAFNKLLSLTSAEKARGVVAASSGNHGGAVAYGLNQLHIPGMIFVPENAAIAKVEAIKSYRVPLQFYANDCVLTETFAREYALQRGMTYISPYNDPDVIAGQGTIGCELAQQLKNIDVVLVPIGGGGLIAGIAAVLKELFPSVQVIGCLPAHSPVMAESIKAGHIIEMNTLPTLSDATAGGIEADAITFNLCRSLVDEYLLCSEDAIREAILLCIKTHRILIEGAAGVALAALLKNVEKFKGKNCVAILSGGNISLPTLRSLMQAEDSH